MSELPLPPPPIPEEKPSTGFHLPRTNLTLPVRRRLEALEQPIPINSGVQLSRGLLLGFLLAAPAGVANTAIFQYGIVSSIGSSFGPIVFSNFIGEAFKVFCLLAVVFLFWRTVPNRRYGAVLGAGVGLGFGIGGEAIVIAISQFDAGHIALGLVFLTLMDIISGALIGIGVFAFFANKKILTPFAKNILGLPLFFYLIAALGWMLWNALSIAAGSNIALSWGADIFITIPLFAFILRDFLGGHFNFTNFLKPLPEPTGPSFPDLPPPPPPES